jgi:sulfofructose kinase
MKFPFQLSATADIDVVGFGANAVDHLIQVPEYPRFDSKIEFAHYQKEPGGEVATTLVGLQRLGLRTAYAGRFGDDEEGDLGLRSLAAEGMDVTYAERVAGVSTQTAFILIDQGTGERTIIWHRDKRLAYDAEAAPVKIAARGKVLHMTVHDTQASIRMAAAAKASDAVVSIDIDSVPEGLDHLLLMADIVISSSEFPAAMTGLPEHKSALPVLHERYGCRVIGATLGRAGSILFCDGEFIETAGFEVPGGCIDTTGAGDAFRTGFLYGLLNGETIEDTARLANAVAALNCRRLGARSGLPSAPELELFIKQPSSSK